MAEQTIWTIAIVGVIAALVIGFLLGRVNRSGGRQRVAELEAEIHRHEAEISEYKREVDAHFDKTASLFVSMAGSYKNLFEHLSGGYERLSPGATRDLFKERVTSLLIDGPRPEDHRASAEEVSPPPATAAAPTDAEEQAASARAAASAAAAAAVMREGQGADAPAQADEVDVEEARARVSAAPAPATGTSANLHAHDEAAAMALYKYDEEIVHECAPETDEVPPTAAATPSPEEKVDRPVMGDAEGRGTEPVTTDHSEPANEAEPVKEAGLTNEPEPSDQVKDANASTSSR